MADTLLGIVIEKLGSFAQEELATFLAVGDLTQKLCTNLTAIRAVLQDAEEKQMKNRTVKLWLQNLADVAHVLDDILDECSITSKDNKWISCFHPMQILAQLDIGKRMKEVAKKIDDIADQRNKYGLHAVVMEEHQRGDDEWRQTTSVVPEVYGRDRDRDQVVKFLLRQAIDSEELSVYPIVGVGGQGKTTLAQVVFNDEEVKTHFDLKIWVCVSNDFSMMKILESIIESDGKNPNLSSLESMKNKVQKLLLSKRYLLVLDDVWCEDQEEWNKFKILLQCGNGAKGASVLVTTRLNTVASIMGTSPVHHLTGLSDYAIWSLLKQRAFGGNREERAELVTIVKELVTKCVGSPLAAKVLGSLLRSSDEHQWHAINESNFWTSSEDNRVMSTLRLSYYHLKLSLRPCFTFCAVFPKGFEIQKECLIQLWMAHGLVTSKGNLQMEHVGDAVWNELYQRSFFQEVKSGAAGNITFKIHDLVHDLAQSIMGEECVSSDVSNLKQNLSVRVHHISCFGTKGKFDYNMIPFKKIESLRTFLEFERPSKNLYVWPSITPLRALRTSSCQLSALKNLMHLRYLEIYHSGIETLPDSLCELKKLQTLKLGFCYNLSSFPKHLTQLQDLRNLVINDCMALVSTPFRIGELTCLKTLTIFIVGSKIGFGLAELQNIQLGGKLHIKGLENVSNEEDAREANLIGKKDLNRLYLSWGGYANSQVSGVDAARVLEALEPYSGIKSFGVKSYGGIHFPSWMRNTSILKGLVDIILYDCRNCSQLPPFGKLPCLTTLFLSGMRDVKYIDDDLYEPAIEKAFKSLKKLTLRDLPNLERVLEIEGVEMLPQLLKLNIANVPKLTLPSLPSVESLGASRGNEELLKSIIYNGNMYNLKSLSVREFAKLKELPIELSTLSALESLEIRECNEMDLLSEHLLQGLSSLRTLCVLHCSSFKSMSDGMRHLTCLEGLDIFHCPEFVFPCNMSSQISLRRLEIWGPNENILVSLEGIPSLQYLSLINFDSLTSFPDWLGAMTSLQSLDIIGFRELRSLPDSLQQLRNLQKLRIRDCPMLEKRCKKEIGEDWHKIAHIPDFELNNGYQSDDAKPTCCEYIIAAWKLGKQFCHKLMGKQCPDAMKHWCDFDGIIEEKSLY